MSMTPCAHSKPKIVSKIHLASLAAETHIEAEIVSTMCLIINQQKIKRFQEEVYCLSPDIVNMAIANHPEGGYSYNLKSISHSGKRKFYVLDPIHTTSPSDKRMALNTFISICWGVAPLKRRDKDKEIEPPYINISGQKTRYKSFTLKIKLSYM
ncbi:hypothetical protein Ahy_B09g097367 [Arachis hypogaea]|uniref:Uncharacterized protein n=1 Tax=Arachis hypogaea TaxID=3818 RepID=A0A444XPJ8_ARAHY|nr:hypothetical protein Ahy_B09g097367 [Arachis hypogaea]